MFRLEINSGEISLVWPLQISLRHSRICILFAALTSLARSGRGMSTGMLKTSNLFLMFSNMIRALTHIPRNSEVWQISIALFTFVVIKIQLPDLVNRTLSFFQKLGILLFTSICIALGSQREKDLESELFKKTLKFLPPLSLAFFKSSAIVTDDRA